jgi:ubiquinone/menaquinone biosynthesis C-methylase UbiE
MQDHFGRLAQVYDALRYPAELVTPELEALVAAGDLRGRHVLDIGCGTGRTLAALALYYDVRGWGIDPSAEMLSVARTQVPDSVHVQVGAAEELPFLERCFERAYMTLVVHLIDRSRAFLEVRRVLEPGGRLTIKTPDPAAFERAWRAPLFPSYVAIERSRFPTAERLAEELIAAGFARHECARYEWSNVMSKEMALRKLWERSVSTHVLLDEEEYREGLARAERDLPDPVEYTLEMLFVSAISS